MPDAAEQLQRLYLAGFEPQIFERFPKAVGVVRDGCVALLEVAPTGLRLIGAPGWRMGEVLGVRWKREDARCSRRSQRWWRPRRNVWRS